MATLEKLKNYSRLLLQYMYSRFGILKFFGFAILLTLLGTTEIPEGKIFAENVVFIFASLFAFRLLDDAWSFHLDRLRHSKRTYLIPDNFKLFVRFTVFIILVYQLSLFIFSPILGLAILGLMVVSTGLYFLFYKVQSIMTIIPLLKYPVFILCISKFLMPPEVLFLSAGAFFMMLTSDFIDENSSIRYGKIIKVLLIVITGILVFQPWVKSFNLMFDLVFIAIPALLIAFTSMQDEPIYPIVIFPVLHCFDLLFSL